MENPKWYQQEATHKDVNYGNGLRIPLCKVVSRNEWPKDGVWDARDKVSRPWKKVTCTKCLEHKE